MNIACASIACVTTGDGIVQGDPAQPVVAVDVYDFGMGADRHVRRFVDPAAQIVDIDAAKPSPRTTSMTNGRHRGSSLPARGVPTTPMTRTVLAPNPGASLGAEP